MQGATLDPQRTAVVFFDTLKCYAYNSDLTSVLPEARAQVDALVRLLQLARERDLPVFYARADHRPDGRDAGEAVTDISLNNRSAEGSSRARRIFGTEAANIIDEIAPQPGDYQVPKHRWSMFFQTDIELSLRSRDIDTILLAGGSTEVGIGSSIYAGRDLDFRTILVRETMRSGRGAWVSDNFVDLVAPSLARVRTLDQVARMLGAGLEPGATSPQQATTAPAPASIAGADLANDPPLDPRETGILFCDFLKGGHYDADTGKLAAHSRAHVAAAQRLLEAARRLGLPLFYTRPIHRADGADWCSAVPDHERRPMVEKFGRLRINPGSFAGAERTEVIDELAPHSDDYIIRKHRFSGFLGTPLDLSLRRAGVKNLLMGGSSVSAVVASSAYSARDRDFNVVMLRDATKGATPQIEDYFMDHVFPRLGRVRTVDQAIGLLGVK